MKQDFQSKAKILIDKTENDNKLIKLLKDELKRLEESKGVKVGLVQKFKNVSYAILMIGWQIRLRWCFERNSKAKKWQCKTQKWSLCHWDWTHDEREESQRLNDECKQTYYILKCVGDPSEMIEEKEMKIFELEEKIEKLEKDNYLLKNDPTRMMKRTKDVRKIHNFAGKWKDH